MALNETNGKWIWAFETAPHDTLDYDCSEGQALLNQTISGVQTQVVIKTCKDGYMFELNALTGALIWAWEPPVGIAPRCADCFPHNVLNRTEMTIPCISNSGCADTLAYPVTSGFEDDLSYSPTLNYVFIASESTPGLEHVVPLNASNYGGTNGLTGVGTSYTGTSFNNATLEAINAANGSLVWHQTFLQTAYRGGVSNSGNVVFTTWQSGDVRLFNAQTGALIKDLYIGGPDEILPSIGATTAGTEEVFLSINTGLGSTAVPGDLVALTLQNVPASAGTSTTTSTVTAPGATSTVTVGAGATATVTAPGATTTVSAPGATSTVTAPGATATATATVTSTSSGVSSTTLYGVAAVAVIFIIATGYLSMRGRKPAS